MSAELHRALVDPWGDTRREVSVRRSLPTSLVEFSQQHIRPTHSASVGHPGEVLQARKLTCNQVIDQSPPSVCGAPY